MEIRLQRRRPRAGWAWLLLLTAPFAYLAYWSSGQRDVSAGEVADSDSTAAFVIPSDSLRPPDRLADLGDFLASADTSREERRQREYLANAFVLLANAVGSLRGADARAVQEGTASMRRYAESLRGARGRQAAYSDSLRAHFIEVAATIDTLRAVSYAGVPADAELRRAARAIQPGHAIESQHDAVRAFFGRANRALIALREGRA